MECLEVMREVAAAHREIDLCEAEMAGLEVEIHVAQGGSTRGTLQNMRALRHALHEGQRRPPVGNRGLALRNPPARVMVHPRRN